MISCIWMWISTKIIWYLFNRDVSGTKCGRGIRLEQQQRKLRFMILNDGNIQYKADRLREISIVNGGKYFVWDRMLFLAWKHWCLKHMKLFSFWLEVFYMFNQNIPLFEFRISSQSISMTRNEIWVEKFALLWLSFL